MKSNRQSFHPTSRLSEEQLLSKSKKTPVRKSTVHTPSSRRSRPKPGRTAAAGSSKLERAAVSDEPRSVELRIGAVEEFETDDDLGADTENEELIAEQTPEPFGEEVDLDAAVEGHIDDPIRMYLMQMGEIPLLVARRGNPVGQGDRAHPDAFPPQHVGQRLPAARGRQLVEEGPRRQAATRSHDRSLRHQHDREEESAQAARAEPRDARAAACGRTARTFTLRSASASRTSSRHAAWRRLVRRRNKAVRLIEELNLRTTRLQPLLDKMVEIRERSLHIREQLEKG